METLSKYGLGPTARDAIPVAPFAIRGGPARALGEAIVKRLQPRARSHGDPPRTIVLFGRCIAVTPVGFLCERDGHLVFTSTS
jgi:hypothetical protein